MRLARTTAFLLAALAGAAIWFLSPRLAGTVEPWDAANIYYVLALGVAGFAMGVITPAHPLAIYLGVVAGQIVYMLLVLPPSPFMVLGVAFLFGFGAISFLSALAARLVRPVKTSPKAA